VCRIRVPSEVVLFASYRHVCLLTVSMCSQELSLLTSAGREMSCSVGYIRGRGLLQLIEAAVCLLTIPMIQLLISAND